MRNKHCVADGVSRVGQKTSTNTSVLKWFFLLVLLNVTNARVVALNEMFVFLARGYRLKNSVIKEVEVSGAIHCIQTCLTEGFPCKSINYGRISEAKGQCQLNSKRYEIFNPGLLVADKKSDFFQRSQKKESCCCTRKNEVYQSFSVKYKNCAEIYKKGKTTDGVYTINPDGQGAFQVRCDMTKAGGGWTVFQRRIDGSVDFYRNWTEYQKGFGDLNGEFWLGLDKINRLCRSSKINLRIELEDFQNETSYADYRTFAVSNETEKYSLTTSGYSGDAGDSLANHNGMKFSTKDQDNDIAKDRNCAVEYSGAWWYKNCRQSNLNGQYRGGRQNRTLDGVHWKTWRSRQYSLKTCEMKIRPDQF